MKNLFKLLLFCALFVACSEDDSSGVGLPGGPTELDLDGETPISTDTDNDGVIDSLDSCPNEAGVASNDGCPEASIVTTYSATQNLKDVATFPVGMIVSASGTDGVTTSDFTDILTVEYNSITAENDMKPSAMFLGPDPADYDWTNGDAIVAYAKANNLRVHGHTLAWHSQQPGWFATYPGTDAEFETAVMDYITATVSHFAEEKLPGGESVVASWDVLNETFEAQTSSNVLYTRIPDVRAKVFIAARAGDPDVKLFYNDFNLSSSGTKRQQVLNMVEDFQTRTVPVPIDGIGLQMHIQFDWPSTNDMTTAINAYAATGLLIHFSELDIKANPNDDVTELTEARAEQQEAKYKEVVELYSTIPAAQQFGITVWGLRDNRSWLADGDTEWALMYDSNYATKFAHRGFIDGL